MKEEWWYFISRGMNTGDGISAYDIDVIHSSVIVASMIIRFARA